VSFHPTTLVGLRNRLRGSERPRGLFEGTKAAADSGVLGNWVRLLDSMPIYDAVATKDTITQLGSAIRKLLLALDKAAPELVAKVRSARCSPAMTTTSAGRAGVRLERRRSPRRASRRAGPGLPRRARRPRARETRRCHRRRGAARGERGRPGHRPR